MDTGGCDLVKNERKNLYIVKDTGARNFSPEKKVRTKCYFSAQKVVRKLPGIFLVLGLRLRVGESSLSLHFSHSLFPLAPQAHD